ncbi:Phosphoserine phosphatase [Lamellibrachia satsuma]|nr:Phosphoserine phosphatase [Lamellibrachia satsuma]
MGQRVNINEAEMKALWKTADCVCFDVDSTVCTDEAIDELATFVNVGDKVAHLTNDAMTGSMTYNESLRKRLDIIYPSRQQVTNFMKHHPPSLTPGIKELTAALRKKGVAVYLITGGFQSIVESVAKLLDIPTENIFANKLKFFYNGDYAGFDETCPTCESGGKPRVMKLLRERHGYKCIVHVGDGATDMEASPPADGFIGFGGNQVRDKVKAGSAWFVTNFQELLSEL